MENNEIIEKDTGLQKMAKIAKALYPYIKTIVITGLVVFIVKHYLFSFVVVSGNSMYPTYKDGQYAISPIVGRENIRRFDVVCVDVSEAKGQKGYYIVKRVIGLPGETVKYENNQLYVNGEPVEETFLPEGVYTEDFEMTAGADEFIALGDNREHSADSRKRGPLKVANILSNGVYPLLSIGNE